MRTLVTLILAVMVIVAAIGIYATSGAYNVAATDPHTRPVAWLLNTIRERSVDRQAASVAVPDLDDPNLVQVGLNDFEAMCTQCHTRPDGTPSAVAEGLNPSPPDLAESVTHMTAAELFWVTKNGLKMTGMPAWGASHEEAQLWPVVAFLQVLPNLDATGYAEMLEEARGQGGHHDDAAASSLDEKSGPDAQPGEDASEDHDHEDHEH
jgi:mono/diheme cytochrome c family protein